MYSAPSSPKTRAPAAREMKMGSPPTARKARTGLLTPPGITARARSKRALDWGSDMADRIAGRRLRRPLAGRRRHEREGGRRIERLEEHHQVAVVPGGGLAEVPARVQSLARDAIH